jgi:hypothetical protein
MNPQDREAGKKQMLMNNKKQFLPWPLREKLEIMNCYSVTVVYTIE